MGIINFNNTNGIINFNSTSPLVLTDGEYKWGVIPVDFVVGTPRVYASRPEPSAFFDGVTIKESSTNLFLMCYNSTLFHAPSLIYLEEDQDHYWPLPRYSTKIRLRYTTDTYKTIYITGNTTIEGATFSFTTFAYQGNLLIKATGNSHTNTPLTYTFQWDSYKAKALAYMNVDYSSFPRSGTGIFSCTIENQSTSQKFIGDSTHFESMPLSEIKNQFQTGSDGGDVVIFYESKRYNGVVGEEFYITAQDNEMYLWDNDYYGIISIGNEGVLTGLEIATYGCIKK